MRSIAIAELHPTLDSTGAESEIVAHVTAAALFVERVADLARVTGAGELQAVLVELDRLAARVSAARLRVLRRAEETRAADHAGFTDVSAWAATATRQDKPAAARDARLARALDTTASATGDALAHGNVTRGHCEVIARTLRQLPDRLDPSHKRSVEQRLLAQAGTMSPEQLRRAARRALAAVEPDPDVVDEHHDHLLRGEQDRALAKARFACWDNGDGTSSGSFTVPTFQAASLRKIIDAMTSPRRARLGAARAQGDGVRRDDPDRYRKLAGIAFSELIEHLPTDHLSAPNATVLVTVTLDALRTKLNAASVDHADELSASEARRLACGAGLVPTVLGGKSRVLDLGRGTRLFTESQRKALAVQHQHCAAEGCERPYGWCELHHAEPWSRGGSTDLANAVPLCWFHHRRIHDPAYEHTRAPDGSARFRRDQ